MKVAWLPIFLLSLHLYADAQCPGAEKITTALAQALDREDAAKSAQLQDELEQQHADCSEIHLYRGRVRALQDDVIGAKSALQRYVRDSPDDARGYAYLALLLMNDQQYQEADYWASMAMQKNPENPAALSAHGQMQSLKGETTNAIDVLEQAVRRNPEDAEAAVQLGALYNKLNRRGEAAKFFEKAVAVVPGNARAWDYLALDEQAMGDPDRAADAFMKAAAANQPGRHYDAFVDYNYGRFLAKVGRLEEAKKHLDNAVALAPDVRAVWYEHARVNLQLKSFQQARDDGEKALGLPDAGGYVLDLQLYALLEETCRTLGDLESANKYAALSRKTQVPVQEIR